LGVRGRKEIVAEGGDAVATRFVGNVNGVKRQQKISRYGGICRAVIGEVTVKVHGV